MNIHMKLIGFLILLFFSQALVAQNIYHEGNSNIFYLKPMGTSAPADMKRGSYVGPHIFGDSVTYLMNEFERSYVYFKTSSGAYPVEEKVVLKRNIYKKVHEFEDFITKSFTHGLVTPEDGAKRLNRILKVGIKLMSYETRQVEMDVKKIKVPTEFEKYLLNLRFN